MNISKIIICCPVCETVPSNMRLFISLPLSNYQMDHKKLMYIKSRKFICTFKGNMIGWIQLK